MEGNTGKVSVCFLHLHFCDVTKFRDDHMRMRINGPLELLARLFAVFCYFLFLKCQFALHATLSDN